MRPAVLFRPQRWLFVFQETRAIIALLLLTASSGCAWLQRSSTHQAVKSEELQDQAQRAERSGDLSEAILLLSQAVQIHPRDAEAQQRLGQLMCAEGRHAEAVPHLKYAASLSPDDAVGWIRLARAQRECRAAGVAAESLDLALKLEPQNLSALLMRAQLKRQLSGDQAAMELYHRVLAVDPQSTEALSALAQIHLRQRQADLATPILRSLLQKSDLPAAATSETRWRLGIAYGAQQRWPDAVDTLKPSLSTPQHNAVDDWYRLAYAAYQARDTRQTAQAVQQALALEAGHEPSLRLAAVLGLPAMDTRRVNGLPPTHERGVLPAGGLHSPQPPAIDLVVPPGW